MTVPPAKRQRVDHQRGDDGYLPGNIIEIELRNFMTYDHLTCQPAPRLNLVIGPNGSGKSSLVCAIALGLGGEPQILGRASSIGAFVKRGQDSGYVKITLRGETAGESISITRKISTRNSSEWLLNGKGVPKRDVVEVIRKFNIQVNNLTQFLPQDRVCEFAKLSPIQLLEETEKAVGNPELPVQHRTLIEKSRELKKLELTVKQNGDSLNQLKALNAEQEKDVGRVRQRDQLLAKVEIMKKKLPWLSYDMKKMEYKKTQKQEKEAKAKLDEAARIMNELSAPIEQQKHAKADHDAASKKISNLINLNAKKRMELADKEGKLSAQVRSKYAEMDDMRRQDESRQQMITKAEKDLKLAERELSDLPCYEPPKDNLEILNSQIMELEVAANQRRLQKGEKEGHIGLKKKTLYQCLERMKELENKNIKLLQGLKNYGAEKIFEAYSWLQEHKHELKKDVYGPVLLEVNLNDQSHAPYLENQVPHYIWKSFITQDPTDRDFLVKNMRSFDIPVLNYVKNGYSEKTSLEISQELRDLGIYTRLDQVFDAPDAVCEILTSQTPIARSYVGTRETDKRAEEVSRLGIMDFWTPESHYRWSISRYGGHTSASVEAVHASRLFLYSSDAGDVEGLIVRRKELEDAISDLEETIKMLQTEQRQLENDAAILHREREEIVNIIKLEKTKRRDMENRVVLRRKKLDSLMETVDLESSTKRLLGEVSNLNAHRFDIAVKIKTLLIEAGSYKWTLAEKQMNSIEMDSKIREMEADLKQHEKTAVQASIHFEQCKSETEQCKLQLSVAQSKAESIAVITPELAKEFLQMPATIEELNAAIEDHKFQANSILCINQNILEEYEARQRKIDVITAKLETDSKELRRCSSEIVALKDEWLPTLRDLVTRINETFSHNFQEMAVAGEVSLDEHEMDFDKFGILIKVKFRETGQLQVLSAHHQSGGERSVSTILFLVSLQDLTNCPFRVVDEINQGMDLINERKMFQQLVRAASQISTPQCFLLTPKLLDNLEYSDACSILNIMNGPWIKQASEVWKSGKCWRAVKGLN